MASNYTTNYNLCQWEPTDQVQRVDFNADNIKIDTALATIKATADQADSVAGFKLVGESVLTSLQSSLELNLAGFNFSQYGVVCIALAPRTSFSSASVTVICSGYTLGTIKASNGIYPQTDARILFFPMFCSECWFFAQTMGFNTDSASGHSIRIDQLSTIKLTASSAALDSGSAIRIWGLK